MKPNKANIPSMYKSSNDCVSINVAMRYINIKVYPLTIALRPHWRHSLCNIFMHYHKQLA